MRNEREYLRKEQYGHAGNLGARIRLHQEFTQADETWNQYVKRVLEIQEGETVFEMGSGSLYFWREMLPVLPQEFHALLSDLALGILSEGKAALGVDQRVKAAVMDAQTIGAWGGSFDLVIANHMLYHVPDPQMAINEAARLLKPDGRMVAITNGAGHMRQLDELLQRFTGTGVKPHHFHTPFTVENGRPRIEAAFADVEYIPYQSHLWVTEAAVLVDYAASMDGSILDRDQLIGDFQALINRDGGVKIDKVSGAFVARKPRKQ